MSYALRAPVGAAALAAIVAAGACTVYTKNLLDQANEEEHAGGHPRVACWRAQLQRERLRLELRRSLAQLQSPGSPRGR